MIKRTGNALTIVLLASLSGFFTASAAIAEDAIWQVSKATGNVWVVSSGVQQASLSGQEVLRSGDIVRTGRNGRVLLVRGKQTILISPNSEIGIPAGSSDGMSTTIQQRAGSILLQVEKRDVRNFEVETPYLAAVVKGTQFRVSVDRTGSSVDVTQGSVQVADFKTGQYALVFPGQTAKVSIQGKGGLILSGAGKLRPVQQGQPKAPSVTRVAIPRTGLSAPERASKGQLVRALASPNHDDNGNPLKGSKASSERSARLRISVPIGEVKLNFQKVTHGLARAATVSNARQIATADKTVWNTDALTPGNGASKDYGSGNSNNGNGNAGNNGNAYGLINDHGNNGVGNAYGQSKVKSNNGKSNKS